MDTVKMIPELLDYSNEDPGFAQFAEQHEIVAASPDIRKAYRRLEYDIMLYKLDEERRVAEVEIKLRASRSEGKAEGIIEGIAKNQMEIALKAFAGLKQGKSLYSIIDMLKEFDIPDEIIDTARKRAEAETD